MSAQHLDVRATSEDAVSPTAGMGDDPYSQLHIPPLGREGTTHMFPTQG